MGFYFRSQVVLSAICHPYSVVVGPGNNLGMHGADTRGGESAGNE